MAGLRQVSLYEVILVSRIKPGEGRIDDYGERSASSPGKSPKHRRRKKLAFPCRESVEIQDLIVASTEFDLAGIRVNIDLADQAILPEKKVVALENQFFEPLAMPRNEPRAKCSNDLLGLVGMPEEPREIPLAKLLCSRCLPCSVISSFGDFQLSFHGLEFGFSRIVFPLFVSECSFDILQVSHHSGEIFFGGHCSQEAFDFSEASGARFKLVDQATGLGNGGIDEA